MKHRKEVEGYILLEYCTGTVQEIAWSDRTKVTELFTTLAGTALIDVEEGAAAKPSHLVKLEVTRGEETMFHGEFDCSSTRHAEVS